MVGLLALVVPFACVRADVHRYRYEITGRSGEPMFAVELPPDISPSGPWYEVETDSLARLARVAEMRGAMKENETVCHYLGKSLFSYSADTYQLGEHTGLLKYQRNEKGYRTRTDGFTVIGEPTGYSVRLYNGDNIEDIRYSADGKPVVRYFYYYSDKDVLTRYRRYMGSAYDDYLVDLVTGVATSRKKFEDNKLQATSVYTYDENGEVVRQAVYNPDGTPFGAFEYSQGLIVRKNFQLTNGTKEESMITYDEKRRAKEAKFSVNGKLVCTFVYDRLPDGTVKRTRALGPDGALWAEYPDRDVNQVEKNGQASNRNDAILHRIGNWW
jgi:antitoxin component YwqK of YwqJK toxin-antitoxin module